MSFISLPKFFKILLVLILTTTTVTHAQSRWDNYFEHDTLTDKHLGTFVIHVTKTNLKQRKPLLIYIDGSGNYPLFFRKRSGNYNTTIAFDFAKYAKDYTIVLISKPGIPFSDSLSYQDDDAYYPSNDIYNRFYSLEWRAATASKAIDYLVKHTSVDKKSITVMGYSEGSQVAPRVAVLNKKVTNLVCFVGNGLNQLYDFIINARMDAYTNEISAEAGQQIVDSLYNVYEKIYADPNATNRKWFGATYLKWSSFSETTPLENMLKLKIPILYVAGGKDNNQTIIDMDYVKLEFLRKRKTNLTYKVYPNCDHYFQEKNIKDSKEVRTDRSNEVHQFAMDWIKANGSSIL